MVKNLNQEVGEKKPTSKINRQKIQYTVTHRNYITGNSYKKIFLKAARDI